MCIVQTTGFAYMLFGNKLASTHCHACFMNWKMKRVGAKASTDISYLENSSGAIWHLAEKGNVLF